MTTLTIINPDSDEVDTKTLLHEAIPLTGTILYGTYGENNIKNYSHGMFQSVFDYPYLSSSANHILDITYGFSPNNVKLSSSATVQNAKKINVYNQMAQVLNGFEANSGIRDFDRDGVYTDDTARNGSDKIRSCFFLAFSRLLVKDEIKKGTFKMDLGVHTPITNGDQFDKLINITDYNAATSYKVNSPVGEYGILYAQETTSGNILNNEGYVENNRVGLIFYQAGVVVLTSSVFMVTGAAGDTTHKGILHTDIDASDHLQMAANSGTGNGYWDAVNLLTASHISGAANALRQRIYNIQFNNTVELNSKIYFCRIGHNKYNYSSNPTYLTGSKIRVKNDATDTPVAYITAVGLYDSADRLIAVGKLSEPLRKDPTIEYTLRARLDF